MTQDVDLVNHPPHYGRGKIEAIEFFELFLPDAYMFNAMKYLVRHQHKGKPEEDLNKALWYLKRACKLKELTPAIYHLCQWPNQVPDLSFEQLKDIFNINIATAVIMRHILHACRYTQTSSSESLSTALRMLQAEVEYLCRK